MSKKMKTIDGNTAAAHVAYAMSDAAAIYPIYKIFSARPWLYGSCSPKPVLLQPSTVPWQQEP